MSAYFLWYVVVVTTTTCWQLGNDTTYDTEKKNPTSHDVADMSAVSGQHDGKTQRHVVKTNCGRHLKCQHFQLSLTKPTKPTKPRPLKLMPRPMKLAGSLWPMRPMIPMTRPMGYLSIVFNPLLIIAYQIIFKNPVSF